jgi:hypothetical protein
MFESIFTSLATPIKDTVVQEKIIELEYRTIILEKITERIMNHPQVAEMISAADVEEIKSEALESIRLKHNLLIKRKR